MSLPLSLRSRLMSGSLKHLLASAAVGGIVTATTVLLPSAASATTTYDPATDTLTFLYDLNFNESPAGTGPWAKATITNSGAGVFLRLDGLLNAPTANVSNKLTSFLFNVSPGPADQATFTASNFTVSCTSGQCNSFDSPPPANPDFTPSGDVSGANAIAGFDLELFLNTDETNKFDFVDTVTFELAYTGYNLAPSNFNYPNYTDGPSPQGNTVTGLCSAARVQGTGTDGEGSTTIGTNCDGEITKVPGPLPLLGAAAAFGYSRKIRTRIQGSRQQATIS